MKKLIVASITITSELTEKFVLELTELFARLAGVHSIDQNDLQIVSDISGYRPENLAPLPDLETGDLAEKTFCLISAAARIDVTVEAEIKKELSNCFQHFASNHDLNRALWDVASSNANVSVSSTTELANSPIEPLTASRGSIVAPPPNPSFFRM